jgi:hypothetical protein
VIQINFYTYLKNKKKDGDNHSGIIATDESMDYFSSYYTCLIYDISCDVIRTGNFNGRSNSKDIASEVLNCITACRESRIAIKLAFRDWKRNYKSKKKNKKGMI